MGQILFVVWRESVEAMLVVGILHAWLRANPERGPGMWYLWGGVGAGVLLALGLGGALLWFQNLFAGNAQDYFQIAMVCGSAGLILQMVFWMRRHGRRFRQELETGMERSVDSANWVGMLVLVALAVAREGSEMVVFLIGLGMAQRGIDLVHFMASTLTGFLAAGLTFWVLQWGGRRISWNLFFRFSETMLLMLAASLLVTGMERMEGLGWLPSIRAQVWNSAWLLDDNSRIGGVISALTGYRAQPSLLLLLLYGTYWAIILGFLNRKKVLKALPA